MNLADIRAAITAAVKASITANMTGYLLTSIEAPCFEIDFPRDALLHGRTFGDGTKELDLIVRGIVQLGEPKESQMTLDKWLDNSGNDGVKAAIEADKTLGGKVQDLNVVSATLPYELVHRAAPNALFVAAEWNVHILL